MKFSKLSIVSIIALSALPTFAWKNMPDICIDATKQVEAASPAEIIKASLEAVGTGVQDPNLDRNKNFEQQENAFIKTWTATEASFYYGNPKMKDKRADFVKAVCDAYKTQKGKEQKIFLLGLLQNCPDEAALSTLQAAMREKDKDVADAARMAIQMIPEANAVLGNALKTQRDAKLKSGVINAIATRFYDSKKIPTVISQAQGSEEKNATFERAQKNLNFGASLIAGRNWDEDKGLEKFAQKFYAKPDRATVKSAISSGNDREFIIVFPYAFKQFDDLKSAASERYNKSDVAVQAWALTSIGDMPSEAGRDFVIEALKNTKDETVRLGGAWALSEIGDEASAMAIIDLHKAAWADGQNKVRELAEYAAGAMKPSKAFDKAIADGAKNADRSCIRLVAARGVYDAFPSVMQAIKDNKERGDACWVVEKMGMENDFLTICELAVETKDNWLCGRILPIASNVAKRISNPEPVMAKLEQLKAKAEAAGVKAPWDRAIEMVKYKGVLPKKR